MAILYGLVNRSLNFMNHLHDNKAKQFNFTKKHFFFYVPWEQVVFSEFSFLSENSLLSKNGHFKHVNLTQLQKASEKMDPRKAKLSYQWSYMIKGIGPMELPLFQRFRLLPWRQGLSTRRSDKVVGQ